MSKAGVSRPSLAGLKVLIVEDEPDARDLLVVVLQQYGAKTFAVDSTKRALEVLEHGSLTWLFLISECLNKMATN
jgi:CheY-like chemotaxis protein